MPYLVGKSGIKWHYEVEGQGAALLFLHGWGVDARIWRQQTKHFSQTHKTITFDLPGHGDSTFQKVSLRSMGEDVLDLLQQLHQDSVTMVGSSLGGLFGLKMYEINATKFNRMIFVGSLPKFSKSADYPHGLDVAQIRKLNGQLNTAYPSIINVFFRSLFTKQERESRRFKWLQKFRQFDNAPIKQALAEYLEVLENEDLREILRSVSVPVQFVNGTHDPICDMGTIKFLQTLSPLAQLDLFEDCGHFPFLSKPHEFNTVIEKFIKQT